MMPATLMALLAVLSISFGQILFKVTASRIEGRRAAEVFGDWPTLGFFGGALAIYGLATILWVLALRDLELSRTYMFMSVSFVVVPIAATFLFDEQLSNSFYFGVAFILAGLVMTQIS